MCVIQLQKIPGATAPPRLHRRCLTMLISTFAFGINGTTRRSHVATWNILRSKSRNQTVILEGCINGQLADIKGQIILFEGVCLDSRHLDPRRAWKGGSEPHFLTPLPEDPLDPLDPEDPLMSSKSSILAVFYHTWWLGPHSGAMFFWLFHVPLI